MRWQAKLLKLENAIITQCLDKEQSVSALVLGPGAGKTDDEARNSCFQGCLEGQVG